MIEDTYDIEGRIQRRLLEQMRLVLDHEAAAGLHTGAHQPKIEGCRLCYPPEPPEPTLRQRVASWRVRLAHWIGGEELHDDCGDDYGY